MNKLKNYDKDHLPAGIMKKLDKLLQRPDYTPEQVGKQSVAAMSLCMWTIAIQKYAKVAKEVLPKREKLAEMNDMLEKANAQLSRAQNRLDLVMKKVRDMEETLAKLNEEKEHLIRETTLCEERLKRASILTSGLANEETRWKKTISVLDSQLTSVEGDAFLAAASLSYLGAFSGVYRDRMQAEWMKFLTEGAKLSCTSSFQLTEFLSDPIELRDWCLQGLPDDPISLTNGVLVSYVATKLDRSPLLIDPQQQAKKWIKNKEAESNLRLLSLTHPKLQNILSSAIRLGQPVLSSSSLSFYCPLVFSMLHALFACSIPSVVFLVLFRLSQIEDVGETLPPLLDPILRRSEARKSSAAGGMRKIKLGDQEIDLDDTFVLYIATKLSNPHYLPEVSLK
ncbi:atpase family associated with various cellular activities domain-containing protein, partial [Cystoisospora suis]